MTQESKKTKWNFHINDNAFTSYLILIASVNFVGDGLIKSEYELFLLTLLLRAPLSPSQRVWRTYDPRTGQWQQESQ